MSVSAKTRARATPARDARGAEVGGLPGRILADLGGHDHLLARQLAQTPAQQLRPSAACICMMLAALPCSELVQHSVHASPLAV